MRRCVLLFGLIIGVLAAQSKDSSPQYKDSKTTAEDRAADLVSRMTLAEKVSQMQNAAAAIPRLGVPAYDWWNEALHGVARAGLATVFPQAIGLAATWDTGLEHRIADVISTEARAKYNDAIRHDNHGRYRGLTFWSPNINIFRDPRWGRGQETYGEDPFLTAEMGLAFIKGLQGSDPHYLKAIATSKHFAVHSGPEKIRHGFNTQVSQGDLDETYLYAFRRTLTEGGADSVMCAYNSVDGVPACANPMLLQQQLRNAWHFNGYVVSDCGAVDDILNGHHFVDSMAKASAEAVKAGTDLTCGSEYQALVEAVSRGFVGEEEINAATRRLFVARFRLGMFDPGYQVPFSSLKMDQVASAEHNRAALEAAEESIVLLKNQNHMLPLETVPRSIAVVGPAADDPDAMLGNYNGTPSHVVTPLAGIQQKFKRTITVRFALGSVYAHSSTALVPPDVLTPGIKAEYFRDDTLAGTPPSIVIEPRLYFYRDMASPTFSVRWTGAIKVKNGGDYRLGFARQECDSCQGSNVIRVFLDDRLLVEERGPAAHGNQSKTAAVRLEAGKAYRVRVEYAQRGAGSGVELVWTPPADALLQEAVQLARQSDVTIAVIGLNSRLEGEESPIEIPGFDHGDRTDLNLPGPQAALLKAVLDTGKPTVVVLVNGSALAVKEAKERAAAILESWYGGQEGGTAIANTLRGDNNPAGRLPVTFYESADQLPPFQEYSMKGRTYRYFAGKPLYPFGYGLSYSHFKYSSVKVEAGKASVRVTNASARDGDEVVQLYVKDLATNPELRGFKRIHLRKGESQQVEFPFNSQGEASIGGGQPAPRP